MGLQAITGIIMILIMASESKHECPNAPVPLNNGDFTYTSWGAPTIWYSCNVGYRLVGKNFSTCNDSGKWNNRAPSCVRCKDPPAPPANGTLFYSRPDKTAVKYLCDLGYKLEGNEYSHCQHTGDWDNSAPSCVRCKDPPAPPANGTLYYSRPDKTAVKYVCDSGYKLEGNEYSHCQHTGDWDNSAPSCVRCKDPPARPANGTLFYSRPDKTAVKYVCYVGYKLEGNEYSHCQHTGDWDNSAPSCVRCKDPPARPANGTLFYSRPDKTAVKYICYVGYKLEGNEYSHCQHTGDWDNSAPSCVRCKDPPAPPANGTLYYSRPDKTAVKYVCDSGYKLEGNEYSHCQHTGDWDNSAPSCVRCKDPPAPPANGTLYYSWPDKTAVEYVCDLGYKLEGNEYSHCQHTGDWDNSAPSCVRCKDPPAPPANGTLFYSRPDKTAVKYLCDLGYKLEGNEYSHCQHTGDWDNSAPSCVRCKDPPAPPANGTLFYSRPDKTAVKYVCDSGYKLEGNEYSHCQHTGDWDNSAPSCVRCKDPPARPANGTLFYSRPDKTAVKYVCYVGYKLEGNEYSHCQHTGDWDNSAPSCVRCKDPPAPPANGTLYYSRPDKTAVKYVCDSGYKLEGNEYSHCQHTGDWDNSAPSCGRCKDPPAPPANGTLFYSGPDKTAVKYLCDLRSKLEGNEYSHCQHTGDWDNSAPSCGLLSDKGYTVTNI